MVPFMDAVTFPIPPSYLGPNTEPRVFPEELQKKGWLFASRGHSRSVFYHPNKCIVIKVPHDMSYRWLNESEYIKFKTNQGKYPKARCRLLKNGWLVMERVTMPYDPDETWHKDYREWFKFLPDGPQVGYTRKGNLVAYDYP